jgi:hypothetical protein
LAAAPWRELAATGSAGGRTSREVLAAIVPRRERARAWLYRAELVTRELAGGARREQPRARRRRPSAAWLAAAGGAMRRLHEAGVSHWTQVGNSSSAPT